MKSTKIENILEKTDEHNVDEDIVETIEDNIGNTQVNDELKKQLEELHNELTNIKQTDKEDITPVVEKTNINIIEETSLVDKIISFSNNDVKKAFVMILIFIIINTTYVNEILDSYIPYSLYTHGYIIKAIIYFTIYRIITKVIT